MKELWDETYSGEKYVYGTNPNEYFKEKISDIIPGRILLPGDGEGRNSVYAATLGWQTEAVDYSQSAKTKAEALARSQNVSIIYKVQNLNDFVPRKNFYDAIALIFVQIPEEEREIFHNKLISSLKTGGALILESFEKDQLKYNSGGPRDEKLLYSLEDLYNDFAEMDIIEFSKEIVLLNEGDKHKGEASVVRFLGLKL